MCQFGTQGSGDRNCNRKCNITTVGSHLNQSEGFDRDSFEIPESKLLCVS